MIQSGLGINWPINHAVIMCCLLHKSLCLGAPWLRSMHFNRPCRLY